MNELQRIKQNIQGEIPEGEATIIKVIDVTNPKEVLQITKDAILSFLNHSQEDENSNRWQRLLPLKIVSFVSKLTDNDYSNDELLFSIRSIISDMKRLKKWEWYSSREFQNGFEIIVQGKFLARFVWFIHCQGVPASSISIIEGGEEHRLRVHKDVTSYKKFE